MKIWLFLLICVGSVIYSEAVQSINTKLQKTELAQFELNYFVCKIIKNTKN